MENCDPAQVQTCVLKMHVKCEGCQKKVKKILQKIHGVHSISIDANEGKVAISSTVDPHLFIAILARAGKKAELLWDSKPPPDINYNKNNSNKKISAVSANAQLFDYESQMFQLAQLQQLAKIPRLKQVELNHSRNIKVFFKDSDDPYTNGDDHVTRIITDDVSGPQAPCSEAKGRKEAPAPPANNHCGGGSGGGWSDNSQSWHEGSDLTFDCGSGHFGVRYAAEPIRPPASYSPHPPPPPPPPPPCYGYQQPPPPPQGDVYCCDHNNACRLM